MSEDRLESLALISIEHKIATLEYGTLIDSFSSIKARKIAFHATLNLKINFIIVMCSLTISLCRKLRTLACNIERD